MSLADTDVLIDFRKANPAAGAWFASMGTDLPLIPGMVAMEFLGGSQNAQQLGRAQRFLATLSIVWHTEADGTRAFELLTCYRLSTGLSLADFLIAAQALNGQTTLYAFNLKHFSAIPGLDARAPHAR